MGFLLQCNDMHLAEKAFLCATVGGEGLTQGELAELYNLLKPPLQVTILIVPFLQCRWA